MIETVSFSRTVEKYNEYADRSISKKIAAGIMTQADGDLIREFVAAMRVQNNIGESRAYKLTNALSNICRFIKTPLMENTIADINNGVLAIKNGKRIAGKNHKQIEQSLSQDTKRDYVVFLKRLYLYAIEEGYCSIPADKIQKIRAPPKNKATKTAEQMLTKSEVLQMIQACNGSTGVRDRAMLSVLYEAGLRINELAGLLWSDVKFEGPFVKINVSSKTGIPRYVPLTMAKEYLSSWRNEYPDGIPERNKPVFLTTISAYKETDAGLQLVTIHKNLTYDYLRKHIRLIGKRAGITKKITCHLFRHSRVTALLQDGFQESTIKLMLWGSLTSNMLANYGHLCNNDIDKAIAKAAGFELEGEETENPLANKICPRCHTINTPTSGYCHVCGLPLTKEAAMELEDAKAEIHADERYKTVIENMQKQIDALNAICQKE